MFTGFVFIKEIVFANVIFKVKIKSIRVLLVWSRAQIRSTDNLHILYTGDWEVGLEVLAVRSLSHLFLPV